MFTLATSYNMSACDIFPFKRENHHAMHFIHSQLFPQGEIENCIVADQKLPREVDVILFFKKYIQLATFSKKVNEITYTPKQNIYIETHIIWSAYFSGKLATITQDGLLIISEIGKTMNKISSLEIKPMSEEILSAKNIQISDDHNKILISYGTDYFIIVNISEPEKPTLDIEFLEGFKIETVSPAPDGCFSLLCSVVNEAAEAKKKLLTYNPKKSQISEREISEEYIDMIPLDTPSKHHPVLIKADGIDSGSGQVAALTETVDCYTHLVGDSFAFQTNDGNLFFATTSQSVQIPDAPTLKEMWLLPNDVLIANLIGGGTVAFQFQRPPSGRKKAQVSTPAVIQLQTFVGNQQIINSNGNIYALSFNGITQITEKYIGEYSNVGETELQRLIQVDQKSIAATGKNRTEIVCGQSDLKADEETIAFAQLKKNTYQITESGIYNLKGEKAANFEEGIRMASSDGVRLAVVTGKSRVSLFTESLQKRDDVELTVEPTAEITAVAVSSSKLAIYSFDSSPVRPHGTLTLLDFAFEQVCPAIKLPSAATSMCFTHEGKDMLVACANGSLIRAPISSGFTHGITLAFSASGPLKLTPCHGSDKFVLLSSPTKTFVVSDGRVIDAGILGTSACFSKVSGDEATICFIKDNKVSSFVYNASTPKHAYRIDGMENALCMTVLDGNTISSHMSDDSEHFFVKLAKEPKDNSHRVFVQSEDIEGEAYQMAAICEGESILILVAYETAGSNNSIALFRYENDSITTLTTMGLPTRVGALCAVCDGFAVGVEKKIIFVKRSSKGLRIGRNQCILGSVVTAIATTNDFVWAACSDGRALCLTYSPHAERFELVGERRVGSAATCISPVDGLTAVIGTESGALHFLRVPAGRARGIATRQLEGVGAVDIGAPLRGLTRIGQCILYLTEGGAFGGLVPAGSTDDFMCAQATQEAHRAALTGRAGFCVPSFRALGAQADVLDADLAATPADDSPKAAEQAMVAEALIAPYRESFMF